MNYKLLTTVGEFRMEQNQDKRKQFYFSDGKSGQGGKIIAWENQNKWKTFERGKNQDMEKVLERGKMRTRGNKLSEG